MRTYPADALFADRTAEPTGGVPSLSDAEIVQLYNWWFNRPPDGVELASERANGLKYSAAGIERQIANRAGNVSGSGVRGDEGLVSLTVAAPPPISVANVGSVIAGGTAAIYGSPVVAPGGPTGLVTPYYGAGVGLNPYATQAAGFGGFGGLSLTTIAIGALALGAAWYLLKGRL